MSAVLSALRVCLKLHMCIGTLRRFGLSADIVTMLMLESSSAATSPQVYLQLLTRPSIDAMPTMSFENVVVDA